MMAWSVIALVSTLFIAGCAGEPDIYTMDPALLEKTRSEIETVGVFLSPDYPQIHVFLPAKGVWGGAKRGLVVGGAMPIMIGFVAPVPGGTALGALLSPLGALAGCVHGVRTALPAEEVAHAEKTLVSATDSIRQMGLRESFLKEIVRLGNERTGLKFREVEDGPTPTGQRQGGQGPISKKDPVDAMLVVEVEKSGLSGQYSIDPPMDVFLQIHVKLVRSEDDIVLLEENFTCASDAEITFKQWSAQNGRRMIEELRSCAPELAEKVIDDFFMVFPVAWQDG